MFFSLSYQTLSFWPSVIIMLCLLYRPNTLFDTLVFRVAKYRVRSYETQVLRLDQSMFKTHETTGGFVFVIIIINGY